MSIVECDIRMNRMNMDECNNNNDDVNTIISVVDLLSQRERYGIRNYATVPFSTIQQTPTLTSSISTYTHTYTRAPIKPSDLSIVSAWNPSRLNNMILAVGPGTPASVLLSPEGARIRMQMPMPMPESGREQRERASQVSSQSQSQSQRQSEQAPLVVTTRTHHESGAAATANSIEHEHDPTSESSSGSKQEVQTQTIERGREREITRGGGGSGGGGDGGGSVRERDESGSECDDSDNDDDKTEIRGRKRWTNHERHDDNDDDVVDDDHVDMNKNKGRSGGVRIFNQDASDDDDGSDGGAIEEHVIINRHVEDETDNDDDNDNDNDDEDDGREQDMLINHHDDDEDGHYSSSHDSHHSSGSSFFSTDHDHDHDRLNHNTMQHSAHYSTSIRHGGCINTATWMDCPWRISLTNRDHHGYTTSAFDDDDEGVGMGTSSSLSLSYSSNAEHHHHGNIQTTSTSTTKARAVESRECPTQLMTSGDDRLVKIWNCSSAMGTISPIPSDDVTACPFAYYDDKQDNMNILLSSNNNNKQQQQQQKKNHNHTNKPTSSSIVHEWNQRYYRGGHKHTNQNQMHGIVELLVTVKTGHRGNVFHATPIPSKPGKILTCAADGYLLLSDIDAQCLRSNGIGGRIGGNRGAGAGAGDTLSSSSSTSSSSITVLAPRDELRMHGGMCFSHHMLDENSGLVCSESGLRRFDIRLPPRSQPSASVLGGNRNGNDDEMCKSCAIFSVSEADSAYVFAGGSSDVGLYDLRFLTDNDDSPSKVIQTYRPSSFPTSAEVSVSGIDISKDKKELLVSYENDQIYTFPIFPSCVTDPTLDEMTSFSKSHSKPNHHFASYGGHLNRFTFLKSAKYAGPNDEYICTGSDSGHAFIYDKKTTSVVSMMKADTSTCNGIVPHPTLPIFITYGIGSTAKLWRATIPVNDEADDSIRGRRKAYHARKYTKSNVVSRWKEIQAKMAIICSSTFDEDDDDDDESVDEDSESRLFPDEYAFRNFNINGHLFEGLPESFFRSLFHDNPFNPGSENICNDLKSLPEVLMNNYYEALSAERNDDDPPVRCSLNELHRRISVLRLYFQANQLGLALNPKTPWLMNPIKTNQEMEGTTDIHNVDEMNESTEISVVDTIPDSPADYIPYDALFSDKPIIGGTAMNENDYKDFYLLRYQGPRMKAKVETKKELISQDKPTEAWASLEGKIKLLKEEGNKCLKNGSVQLAANYYDKAIKYCSVIFMNYPHRALGFIKDHQKLLSMNGGHSVQWTDVLKMLISTRLNLSMTMLKEELCDPEGACTQASLALRELQPFCVHEGVVMTGRKMQKARGGEPVETFLEAKELQVKAFFRRGSAKFKAGEYTIAMRNFEQCLSAKKEIHPDAKPDKAVVHGIKESRRLMKIKKKRRRKKFKLAFDNIHDGKDDNDDDMSRHSTS